MHHLLKYKPQDDITRNNRIGNLLRQVHREVQFVDTDIFDIIQKIGIWNMDSKMMDHRSNINNDRMVFGSL